MTKPVPDRQAVEQWLVAVRDLGASNEAMNLRALPSEYLPVVAADIESIIEACEEVAGRLRGVLGGIPSAESLEDALIVVDLSLNHSIWHWKSTRDLLLEYGLWDRALIDDDDDTPSEQ
ncbi:MAG: hypothetical protein LC792_02800 [Actinobacteria bacterium]|nr:hypothetical protein [Actinomycetota bacterium]